MLKKLTLGIILLSTSLFSQAGIITDLTGADMAGIEVTAIFNDGRDSETITWAFISDVLGTTDTGNIIADNIVNHDGFSGGVSGTGWSLTQSGYTLGEFIGGQAYGLWNFEDTTGKISSLIIDVADTGILFDTELMTAAELAQSTNDSKQGRGFLSAQDPTYVTGAYSEHQYEELFNVLTLTLKVPGTNIDFWADADKVEVPVPEPSTMFTFALGLMALISLRKKSSKE